MELNKLTVVEMVQYINKETGEHFTVEGVRGVGVRLLKDGEKYSPFFNNFHGLKSWFSIWWIGYKFAMKEK